MRKLVVSLVMLLGMAAPGWAQSSQALPPIVINAQDAGSCATAGACAVVSVKDYPAVLIDVDGTWTGTLTFECTSQVTASPTWRTVWAYLTTAGTLAGTTTANGGFSFPNPGFNQCRVRAGTFTPGSATITFHSGYKSR